MSTGIEPGSGSVAAGTADDIEILAEVEQELTTPVEGATVEVPTEETKS